MTPAPTDADFDDMHHALGRPDGPHVKPYRNFYSCAADGPTSQRFRALGLWEEGQPINQGRDAVFRVNEDGYATLMTWLVDRQRKAGMRPWVVHGGGITARTVVAKSRGAARYEVYLDLTDVWNCTFAEFLSLGIRTRAA